MPRIAQPLEHHHLGADQFAPGAGQPVNGLLFSILFVSLEDEAREFQIIQRASGDLVVRVVMATPGAQISPHLDRITGEFVGKYLPGIRWSWDYVDAIPASAGGKRHIVVVEPRPAP